MSFKARKANIPGLAILRIILFAGFTNEMISQALKIFHLNENIPHYFYIPLEYCLFVLFYCSISKNKQLRQMMRWSVFVYMLVVAFIVITHYKTLLYPYPSQIYNIECGLNILWGSILLFNLETKEDVSITAVPIFWIISGLLIFYAGIFFFNVVYNYFVAHDKILANALRTYVNTTLNNLLYLSFLYAFYSSWTNKKYLYPQL